CRCDYAIKILDQASSQRAQTDGESHGTQIGRAVLKLQSRGQLVTAVSAGCEGKRPGDASAAGRKHSIDLRPARSQDATAREQRGREIGRHRAALAAVGE